MGKVFSYNQVQMGIVPEIDNFETAKQTFLEGLAEGITAGHFYGGYIFGSVARGTPNIRSDFDSLLALTTNLEAYSAARALSKNVLNITNNRISANPQAYPKVALASGEHEIDQLFGRHLVGDCRIVVGEDPADYMTIRPESTFSMVGDFIYHKARRLTDGYTNGSNPLDVTNNTLQRTLELPNSLGREILSAYELLGCLISR